ncbi:MULTISPECIES: hypothetical protein [unclassified Neisseria]|uniref:hypothetical protein n=1 Tax=unclassified Neisseria TaxID=2623750 RepID=UPI00107284F9|nr:MULTISPECIES: hypothetical protein [unclassified Neisseria]MBF0803704.1 hypothetical protein [Neisseria sp. 19428wB4_WF04]TFU43611.1 hypothetical protein E4T99_04945 [Neisseria sp. WF04]
MFNLPHSGLPLQKTSGIPHFPPDWFDRYRFILQLPASRPAHTNRLQTTAAPFAAAALCLCRPILQPRRASPPVSDGLSLVPWPAHFIANTRQ